MIRGETPHFDYIAGEAAKGLSQTWLRETGVPVAFGVLTTNTLEQAIDRAGAKGGNKGFDAAMTAIEMANLMRRLRANAALIACPNGRPAADPVSARCRSCFCGMCGGSRWTGRHRGITTRSLYSEESGTGRSATSFSSNWCRAAVEHVAEIDPHISGHAEHWRIERMPAVDRNILRLAVFEMTTSETPAAVVIDEALELARKFSSEESVQFVNGVLDAVHREQAGSGRQQPARDS